MTVDLTTRYLGLELPSPMVASASPMTGAPSMWERLERSGVGAVVLPSLFEEEIEREALDLDAVLDQGTDAFGEAQSYLPSFSGYDSVSSRHLALVEAARRTLHIPVIASLNGTTPGGWVRHARRLVDAGAQAIELNLYDVVVDPLRSAEDVERGYVALVDAVRAEVEVPLAVKLSPWFTALPHVALALQAAGVDGLVLFNRLYQPDLDLATLGITPHLHLSTSAESRLPLHWIGILRPLVACSLAATTGVHEGPDALKLLLVGADVTMMASALLRHGPERAASTLEWLRDWMTLNEYTSVAELRGSVSRANVPDPTVYERANYQRVLQSWGSPR